MRQPEPATILHLLATLASSYDHFLISKISNATDCLSWDTKARQSDEEIHVQLDAETGEGD